MADDGMEPFEERLKGWTLGADREWALILFTMLRNTLETEVAEASKKHLLMLTLLGIHAVMQTVTEKVFGCGKGFSSTEFYLKEFVDTPERQYSTLAEQIHRGRNVMAHQGFSITQYEIAYDWGVTSGFEWRGKLLAINPDQYVADYIGGSYKYSRVAKKLISEFDMVKRKYAFIRDFLELPDGDVLRKLLGTVKTFPDLPTLRAAEPEIQKAILTKYGIT